MPLITAAIIGGIATAASGYMSSQAQDRANRSNVKLARENRDVQINLADTAHQREVADLRAAGLNPILSGTGGAGAGVPSSAAAQVQPVNPLGDVGHGISTAAMARAQLDLIKEQTRKTSAEATQAEDTGEILGYKVEDERGYRAYLNRDGYRTPRPEGGYDEPDEDFKSNFFTRRQASRFETEVTPGEQARTNVQMSAQELANKRQELANLVQQHNIGQSAEVQARILKDIYQSNPGEVLKLLSILKDLIR